MRGDNCDTRGDTGVTPSTIDPPYIHQRSTSVVSADAQTAPPAKPEEKPEAVKAAKPAKLSKPDEVDDQVWADFLQVRKAKRSPLTATALAGIEREAAKAGIGLQQALEVCCESGWVGFKADWYANRTAQDALRRTSRAGNTHKHAAAGATIFEGVWDA